MRAGGLRFRDRKCPDGLAVAKPAPAASFVGGNASCVDLTIVEGRYRQVRRCWEALAGNKVVRLLRLSFGPVALGGLEPGKCHELGPAEVAALRCCVGAGTGAGGGAQVAC